MSLYIFYAQCPGMCCIYYILKQNPHGHSSGPSIPSISGLFLMLQNNKEDRRKTQKSIDFSADHLIQ